jgi:hypothetical protein
MRFVRFSTPTKVTLLCGTVVTAISAAYGKNLYGSPGEEEWLFGAVTPELKRIWWSV